MDAKKIGPFKIIRKINPVAFKLALPKTMKCHPVFHVSLLEPKCKNSMYPATPGSPLPIIVDSEYEYEVEEILDSRISRNQLQYLVHWKDFPISERTWESARDVANSPDLIADFHLRFPMKPQFPILTN